MQRIKAIDVNTLLQLANALVVALGIYFYNGYSGINPYIDAESIALLIIFGLINANILLLERHKAEPFVIITVLTSIIFYMGRVVTLANDPWSLAFMRCNPIPNDINRALIYILCANIALFSGLFVARRRIFRTPPLSIQKPARPHVVLFLLGIALFLNFSNVAGDSGRLVNYLRSLFINPQQIILYTTVYLVLNFVKIGRLWKFLIIVLIAVFIVLTTLSGSRSAFLTIGIVVLIGFLAVNGRFFLKVSHLFFAIALVPVAVVAFTVATFIRSADIDRSVISFDQLTALQNYSEQDKKTVSLMLRPVFDRMGYLDYATELITQSDKYSQIINIPYYFKSIIDNSLTPGFDVFDTPKISNAMIFIYERNVTPSHAAVNDSYHSDELTAYGETYVLMGGVLGVIWFFVVGFFLRWLYERVKSKDAFRQHLYRALILLFFYYCLNSFGMDWHVNDLINIVLTLIFFTRFYTMRNQKPDGQKNQLRLLPVLPPSGHQYFETTGDVQRTGWARLFKFLRVSQQSSVDAPPKEPSKKIRILPVLPPNTDFDSPE